MWGIYTLDSDTRRSPSPYRDSLSFRSNSLENVRMLGINTRSSSRASSQKDRESNERVRLFDDGSLATKENISRQSSYVQGDSRRQIRLENGAADDKSPSDMARYSSRASTVSSTRHDSERRLIRNHNHHHPRHPPQHHHPNHHAHHQSSGNNRNVETDPDAEAAAIREKKRRRIVFVIFLVAASLLLMSILIMVITVQLTPSINEKLRQEHKDFMQQRTQHTTASYNGTTSSPGDVFSSVNTTVT